MRRADRRVDDPNLRDFTVWALLLRTIPVTLSFLLFVLALSVDADKWGSRSIQIIVTLAISFGVVGVALFIPRKV